MVGFDMRIKNNVLTKNMNLIKIVIDNDVWTA